MITEDTIKDLITKFVNTNGKEISKVFIMGDSINAFVEMVKDKSFCLSLHIQKFCGKESFVVVLDGFETLISKDTYDRLCTLLKEYDLRLKDKHEEEIINYIYD